jgi:hypothetical protein
MERELHRYFVHVRFLFSSHYGEKNRRTCGQLAGAALWPLFSLAWLKAKATRHNSKEKAKPARYSLTPSHSLPNRQDHDACAVSDTCNCVL